MKNSTLHRSNLSREKMALLADLKARKSQSGDNAPGIYKRPNKQKELDILWQSFKVNQREEKSPGIYLLTGFIVGALSMFLMSAVVSISSNSGDEVSDSTMKMPKLERKLIKRNASKLAIVPPDKPAEETASSTTESYTVKSGDTIEGIVIRFYGKYDKNKVSKIMIANNMKNPNEISIGEKLTIPMD